MGSGSTFATRTTTRLLDALLEPGNEPVWIHFDARYRPVIIGLAKRLGLRQSDAEEVAQQTLSEFVRAYREKKYDRTKGRLSSWILGIAHHTTLRAFRSGSRAGSVDVATIEATSESTLRTIWTDERDRSILLRALAMLREESEVDERTLLAFELTALRGVPPGEAGEQCAMTADQVYVARSRVTKRLRGLVAELTAAFEEDT